MLLNLTKEELETIIYCLEGYLQGNDDEELSDEIVRICTKVEQLSEVCTCRENITSDDDYLDSLSEGYDTKVDALVDSMGVTDKKVSTTHTRKDLDLL